MNARTEQDALEKPEVDQAIIDEARSQGWRPLEEFDGPEDRWVPADTFVQRGREINPILRKHNEALKNELAALKNELKEAGQSIKSLQEYNQQIEQRAYDRAIRELKAERKKAIANQDHESLADIDEQLEELKEQKPAPLPEKKAEQAPTGLDPVFAEWVDENKSWFHDGNQELLDYAAGVGPRIAQKGLKGRAFLDELKRQVQKTFPEKFNKKGGPAMVEGSGEGAPPSGTSGINSLPNDARAELARLRKEKWYVDLAKSKGMTPDQMFMSDYQ